MENPSGYGPRYLLDEYGPADIEVSEGGVAESKPVCVGCWTPLPSDSKPCTACGRPQDISDMDWLKIRYAPLTCEKCARECSAEEEGFCSECGGQCRVAA